MSDFTKPNGKTADRSFKIDRRILFEAMRLSSQIKFLETLDISEQTQRRIHHVFLPVRSPSQAETGSNKSGKGYSRPAADKIVEVFNRIAGCSVDGRTIPLGVKGICELNGYALEGTEIPETVIPGQLRQSSMRVANYRAPAFHEVPEMMESLSEWITDESVNPISANRLAGHIVKAIVAHEQLLLIHPFGDGNGRTARATEFAMLLNAGVPTYIAQQLSNHYNETRHDYYRHLSESHFGETNRAFVVYALQGLNRKVSEIITEVLGEVHLTRRVFLKAGFTLVELLFVVLILGTLASIIVPRVVSSATSAKTAKCRANVQMLNKQIELYYVQEGQWPDDIDVVTSDPDYFPHGVPVCPFNIPYSFDSELHTVPYHTNDSHGVS